MFFYHPIETILAKGNTLTMDTRKSRLNNNIMLVGASGRGKTRNFIMPNILQMTGSYVISDPKGTIVKQVGKTLEKNGYKIKVLNLVDMLHSDTYNPFNYVKGPQDIYKMIEYLMVNVSPNGLSSYDPFWDNATKALLSAICFYLYYECRPEERTIANIMRLLRCLEVRDAEYDPSAAQYESTLDIMFKMVQERNPEHLAVKQYQIFKSAAGKTAQSIQISTEVYLQWFNLDEFVRLTSSDNIDLESIGTEKTALFVIVSDTDRSKNWLAGVFYSQLFDVLCNYADTKTVDGRLPFHVRFFLDDFACTARIPDFDYKMAMVRSREISCVIAIQDEAQLEKEYRTAAQGIITNCDSYVFLGASNVDICNIVAHRLGDSRLSGSDIRKMNYDQCVVICGNEGGIYTKYDLRKHPQYKHILDADPENVYELNERHTVPLSLPGKPKNAEVQHNYSETAEHTIRSSRTSYEMRKPRSENGALEDIVALEFLKDKVNENLATYKSNLFDSAEEEYLYSVLTKIINIHFFPHQHLRDIFTAKNTALSKKLAKMHCDFVARNHRMKVLFAIEIDGRQHEFDVKQIANDQLKDGLFKENNIPLLRFSAEEVRNSSKTVVNKILEAAQTFVCGCTYEGKITTYKAWERASFQKDFNSTIDYVFDEFYAEVEEENF